MHPCMFPVFVILMLGTASSLLRAPEANRELSTLNPSWSWRLVHSCVQWEASCLLLITVAEYYTFQ